MAVTVTYNSQVLPNIVGPFQLQESYESIGFSCNFLVKSASAGALTSTCDGIEEKLREPFETLTINFGGGAAYSFSHDDNTCLNSQAFFSKSGSELDTETSRMYNFKFQAGLPADKSGFNFRRKGDFSISQTSNGKRVVRFSLEYTASPSPDKTSEENFDDQAETYATGVLSSLFSGVTFDRGDIVKNSDQEQKVTMGTITYTEIFEPESLAGTNDANLKNVRTYYSIDRGQRIGASTSGYTVIPMTTISIRYSTDVVKENFATNDLLHEYYLNNIKPHIIQRAILNLNLEGIDNTSQGVIVESETFDVDPVTYAISATLNLMAPSSTTDVIRLEESIREEFDSGIVTRKLWDGLPFSKSGYHMGSDLFITRTTTVMQLGTLPAFPEIINDPDLLLKKRIRSGAQEFLATNTEVGEQNISIFTESFIEIYERAVIVENQPVPKPNPSNQIFLASQLNTP